MLLTVGRYFDVWEAYILCARLRSEEIPAIVSGDQHMIADWPISIALGGAALQVPAEFLQQARDLVQAYHSGKLELELVEEHPETLDRCPACQSQAFRASVPLSSKILNVFSTAVFSAPFSTAASDLSCQSCGHSWRYGG
jgi:hypothetical protein